MQKWSTCKIFILHSNPWQFSSLIFQKWKNHSKQKIKWVSCLPYWKITDIKLTSPTRLYFAQSIAWRDALPILSFVFNNVSSIPSKVSLEIAAYVSPLSVPPTDFCSEFILPSSLDSRSILFGRPHCCTLTLGLLDYVWEMASFVSSVYSL